MNKIKNLFDYKTKWKHQKNRCRNLRKRINKLQKGIYEDLGFNEKDEIIRKQEKQLTSKSNRIKKLELEAQKYFNMLIDSDIKLGQANHKIDEAIEKLYCWGEALNPDFQKEMLDILKGSKNND